MKTERWQVKFRAVATDSHRLARAEILVARSAEDLHPA